MKKEGIVLETIFNNVSPNIYKRLTYILYTSLKTL